MSIKQEYYERGYKPTQRQKVAIFLRKYAKAFTVEIVKGKPMDVYAIRCPEHGYVLTKSSGHYEMLYCPYCPRADGVVPSMHDFQKIKVS